MLCQNCGKKEVNFRYTQIVNGVKKKWLYVRIVQEN